MLKCIAEAYRGWGGPPACWRWPGRRTASTAAAAPLRSDCWSACRPRPAAGCPHHQTWPQRENARRRQRATSLAAPCFVAAADPTTTTHMTGSLQIRRFSPAARFGLYTSDISSQCIHLPKRVCVCAHGQEKPQVQELSTIDASTHMDPRPTAWSPQGGQAQTRRRTMARWLRRRPGTLRNPIWGGAAPCSSPCLTWGTSATSRSSPPRKTPTSHREQWPGEGDAAQNHGAAITATIRVLRVTWANPRQ